MRTRQEEGYENGPLADRQHKAGSRCQAVHGQFLHGRPPDLQHVQADEPYAKRQGGRSWMSRAMGVPSRLWPGGVVGTMRNMSLIQKLVDMVRVAWLPGTVLLICADGLASYVTAFRVAFREKVVSGKRGTRPTGCQAGCGWRR